MFEQFSFTGLLDEKNVPIKNKDVLKCLVKVCDTDDAHELNFTEEVRYSVIEWWHSDYFIGYRLRNKKGHTMKVIPISLKTMKVEVVGNLNVTPNLLKEL